VYHYCRLHSGAKLSGITGPPRWSPPRAAPGTVHPLPVSCRKRMRVMTHVRITWAVLTRNPEPNTFLNMVLAWQSLVHRGVRTDHPVDPRELREAHRTATHLASRQAAAAPVGCRIKALHFLFCSTVTMVADIPNKTVGYSSKNARYIQYVEYISWRRNRLSYRVVRHQQRSSLAVSFLKMTSVLILIFKRHTLRVDRSIDKEKKKRSYKIIWKTKII